MPNTKCQVIGHRGCRGLLPENTIAAFIKAVDLGVDAVELDVVITKDKQVLVSHEPWMHAEICLDKNGNEIKAEEEKKLNIFEMMLEEAMLYDCGIKHHPRFPQQQKIKAHKPLLSEVITALERQPSSFNKPIYLVEIKSTEEGDGIFHPPPQEFCDLVTGVIQHYKLEERTILQSFDTRILKYIHIKYPLLQLALLVEKNENVFEKLNSLGFIPPICSPHFSLVDDKVVEHCRAHQMKIFAWTVNDDLAFSIRHF